MESMSILENLSASEPGIVISIMSYLTASDNSVLKSLLRLRMYNNEKQRLLNPSRDLLQYQDWMIRAKNNSYIPVLIGCDLTYLIYKIRYPYKFRKEYDGSKYMNIGILAIKYIDGVVTTIVPTYDPAASTVVPTTHHNKSWKVYNELKQTMVRVIGQAENRVCVHNHYITISFDMYKMLIAESSTSMRQNSIRTFTFLKFVAGFREDENNILSFDNTYHPLLAYMGLNTNIVYTNTRENLPSTISIDIRIPDLWFTVDKLQLNLSLCQ